MKTLREKIEESKVWHLQKYGVLDWHWTDEGLPYSIMDYHGSVGSIIDFSVDDWKVCKESGFSQEDICRICDELWYIDEVESLSWFLDVRMGDWKDSNGGLEREIRDEEVPQDVVSGFVSDFYLWRTKILPSVMEVMK